MPGLPFKNQTNSAVKNYSSFIAASLATHPKDTFASVACSKNENQASVTLGILMPSVTSIRTGHVDVVGIEIPLHVSAKMLITGAVVLQVCEHFPCDRYQSLCRCLFR